MFGKGSIYVRKRANTCLENGQNMPGKGQFMPGKGSIYVGERVNIFQVKGQYIPEKRSIYVRKRVNICYSACNGYVFRKSTTLIQY